MYNILFVWDVKVSGGVKLKEAKLFISVIKVTILELYYFCLFATIMSCSKTKKKLTQIVGNFTGSWFTSVKL